ncbi:MAG: GTP-binding and nucleic acid-binding protein YchF [uncultured Campylobacterales bacterium]|uniref:Ribosome-binding ATPase YchF n=1 Tax=uncultured Campylobacterales bacterium TaxID=352960 RepID=A0A6S6SWV6_9BACT|nr:MAG: GTP-binding and nucleic acid-binding protein YchF [uncultured Campylobacterales bacterium]
MALSVGLVGLPNVGKSTTFNALTKASNAEAQNYPFCTIEPNKAIVPVPDIRLQALANIVKPNKIQASTIEFVDIAGLVKGASKGEGLGNQFLATIREVEIILHIVRCFDDENIIHVEGSIDPLRDIEIIEGELILADVEQLDKKIERLQKKAKLDKKAAAQLVIANELKDHLDELNPVSTFASKDSEDFKEFDSELRFLSNKTIIYGANVDEEALLEDNEYVKILKKYAESKNATVLKLCAKVEEELIDLEDEEAKEFLTELGVQSSGLDVIIKQAFNQLGLINYFTAGVTEVSSWTIQKGWLAPKSASVIHNDFEKGFIRAEVIAYDDYIEANGEAKAKENGKLRLEGKDYEVKDGDVMHFRFNV